MQTKPQSILSRYQLNPFSQFRISEMRSLLEKRKVSVPEIVKAYQDQADAVNPGLNAIVAQRWAQALKEAEKIQIKIDSQGTIPRLAGLPFTVKEMIEASDMPLTVGQHERRHYRGQINASVIDFLRGEGAILAGVTNVPELGWWFETYNVVYGTTRNPFDLDRTAGGSSGGEAAVIAAHGSAFGIGSDVGGSIRIPAHFCGLFGHKPSRFLVPMTGHFPMSQSLAESMTGRHIQQTVMGPMARNAEDLIEIFRVMARPDGFDRDVKENKFCFDSSDTSKSWEGRVVYLLSNPKMKLCFAVDEEIQEAAKNAAQTLQKRGARVVELDSRLLEDAFYLWSEAVSEYVGPSFLEKLGQGRDPSLVGGLISLLMGRPTLTLPILINGFKEKYLAQKMKSDRYRQELQNLKIRISEWLGERNILIMPTHPRAAFPHYQGIRRPFDFSYTAIWNALDFPVTQVPMGFTAEGLPIGVQIVANSFCDLVSLRAAKDLEGAHEL